jgi:REP element-mobilizing transposase RayT
MVAFPYRGGYRYHLVFTTRAFQPSLKDEWAAAAVEELNRTAEVTGFTVEAYTVMPNHVHVLLAGDAALESDMKAFAHKFKQGLGYRFKQATGAHLWHRSYYDRVVRNEEPVRAHVAYILNNPVAGGLVETPDAWRYSGPKNALEEVSGALQDRSKDLSVQMAVLSREFKEHEAGLTP